jgi:hypothetical protein
MSTKQFVVTLTDFGDSGETDGSTEVLKAFLTLEAANNYKEEKELELVTTEIQTSSCEYAKYWVNKSLNLLNMEAIVRDKATLFRNLTSGYNRACVLALKVHEVDLPI